MSIEFTSISIDTAKELYIRGLDVYTIEYGKMEIIKDPLKFLKDKNIQGFACDEVVAEKAEQITNTTIKGDLNKELKIDFKNYFKDFFSQDEMWRNVAQEIEQIKGVDDFEAALHHFEQKNDNIPYYAAQEYLIQRSDIQTELSSFRGEFQPDIVHALKDCPANIKEDLSVITNRIDAEMLINRYREISKIYGEALQGCEKDSLEYNIYDTKYKRFKYNEEFISRSLGPELDTGASIEDMDKKESNIDEAYNLKEWNDFLAGTYTGNVKKAKEKIIIYKIDIDELAQAGRLIDKEGIIYLDEMKCAENNDVRLYFEIDDLKIQELAAKRMTESFCLNQKVVEDKVVQIKPQQYEFLKTKGILIITENKYLENLHRGLLNGQPVIIVLDSADESITLISEDAIDFGDLEPAFGKGVDINVESLNLEME